MQAVASSYAPPPTFNKWPTFFAEHIGVTSTQRSTRGNSFCISQLLYLLCTVSQEVKVLNKCTFQACKLVFANTWPVLSVKFPLLSSDEIDLNSFLLVFSISHPILNQAYLEVGVFLASTRPSARLSATSCIYQAILYSCFPVHPAVKKSHTTQLSYKRLEEVRSTQLTDDRLAEKDKTVKVGHRQNIKELVSSPSSTCPLAARTPVKEDGSGSGSVR